MAVMHLCELAAAQPCLNHAEHPKLIKHPPRKIARGEGYWMGASSSLPRLLINGQLRGCRAILGIEAGDHRLHDVVGVVNGQGFQKPVESAQLAEERFAANTEGSC